MDKIAHVAAAPGPLAAALAAPYPNLAAVLGPLACPSRSARPRNFLSLT